MSSRFSRSLRAIESERTWAWRTTAVAATLAAAWTGWFFFARLPLYETSSVARIEAAAAAHPVDARMLGRAVRVQMTPGTRVRAGDVLVELEGEAERLALCRARARLEAIPPEMAAVRSEIAAEELAIAESSGLRLCTRAAARHPAGNPGDPRPRRRRRKRMSRLRADGVISEAENARARSEAQQKRASTDAAPQPWRASNRIIVPARAIDACGFSGCGGTRAPRRRSTDDCRGRQALDYEVERRLIRAPIDGPLPKLPKSGSARSSMKPTGSHPSSLKAHSGWWRNSRRRRLWAASGSDSRDASGCRAFPGPSTAACARS